MANRGVGSSSSFVSRKRHCEKVPERVKDGRIKRRTRYGDEADELKASNLFKRGKPMSSGRATSLRCTVECIDDTV